MLFLFLLFFFFFFKQKTAYEMLSGDWSSDVCSSDLVALEAAVAVGTEPRQVGASELPQALAVDGAADAIADRVELEPRRARAHAGEVAVEHDEQLGVGQRVVPPEHLGADLVELAVAAALRPLAPEHRPAVEEARARVA